MAGTREQTVQELGAERAERAATARPKVAPVPYGTPKRYTEKDERKQLEKLAALAWQLQAHTEALRRQIDAMAEAEDDAHETAGGASAAAGAVGPAGERAGEATRAIAERRPSDAELELHIELDLDGYDDGQDDPFEDLATRREIPAPLPCKTCGAKPTHAHRADCPRSTTVARVVPEVVVPDRPMSLPERTPLAESKNETWLHRLWKSLGAGRDAGRQLEPAAAPARANDEGQGSSRRGGRPLEPKPSR